MTKRVKKQEVLLTDGVFVGFQRPLVKTAAGSLRNLRNLVSSAVSREPSYSTTNLLSEDDDRIEETLETLFGDVSATTDTSSVAPTCERFKRFVETVKDYAMAANTPLVYFCHSIAASVGLGGSWNLQLVFRETIRGSGTVAASLAAHPVSTNNEIKTLLRVELVDYDQAEFSQHNNEKELALWCVFRELRILVVEHALKLTNLFRQDTVAIHTRAFLKKELAVSCYQYFRAKEHCVVKENNTTKLSIDGHYVFRLDKRTGECFGFFVDRKWQISQVVFLQLKHTKLGKYESVYL